MNKKRRKTLTAALELLEEATAKLEEVKEAVDNAQADEQEYFDNMPENMQSGDKGQAAESAISYLGDAVSTLENAIGEVADAVSAIEGASE